MRRSLRACFVIAAALGAGTAQAAANLTQLNTLNQSMFRNLSEDLGAALSYKPLAPAESLGITGFDVGVDFGLTQLSSVAALEKATGVTGLPGSLFVPRAHVQKGLPFDIDLGVMMASLPGSDIRLTGGEIKYGFLGGNVALPAIAARATMTKLSGVNQLDFSTKSIDLSISKGFLMLKPYAGIGRVWVDSTPLGTAAAAPVSLKPESFAVAKSFVGVNISLAIAAIGVEIDKTGSDRTSSLKLSLRW